jgi:hypothetical protein
LTTRSSVAPDPIKNNAKKELEQDKDKIRSFVTNSTYKSSRKLSTSANKADRTQNIERNKNVGEADENQI